MGFFQRLRSAYAAAQVLTSQTMVFVFYDPPSYPLVVFLIQAFVTLILARAFGNLVSYVKQPRVIDEIIGGLYDLLLGDLI